MKIVRKRAGGKCEARVVCSGAPGIHGHELLLRSQGGSADDPANVILICFDCHRHLHENPAESYRLGLMKRRSEAGSNPPSLL